MSEWRECSIKELIENRKITIGDGYRAKNSELSTEGIPFARAGNINDGFHFEGSDCFPIKDLNKVGNKISQTSDIVFTSKGTVGRFAYVEDGTQPFVYSPQLCFWRTLDQALIESHWLYYWMNSREFWEQAHSVKDQTDMAEYVNLNDQRTMKITLPPLPEQRAIASVLSSLDDKIDLLHRQNKTLEAMAETLFRQWFVEEAEEGWEEGKLGSIMKLSNGKSRPNSSGLTPVYGGNGILDYTDQYNYEGESIIIGRVGSYCSSLFIENCKIWVSDNALHAKAKNENENFFLYYLLKTLSLNSLAEGSSHPLLTQTLLNSIDITIPPISLRHEYNEYAKSIYIKVVGNKSQIRTLEKLRDTLLPKLMSGEVRVTSIGSSTCGSTQ